MMTTINIQSEYKISPEMLELPYKLRLLLPGQVLVNSTMNPYRPPSQDWKENRKNFSSFRSSSFSPPSSLVSSLYLQYNIVIIMLISSVFWNLSESSLGSSSSSQSSSWSAVVVCPAVYALKEEPPAEGSFTAPPPPPPWWRLANTRPPIPYSRLELFLNLQLTSLHPNNTSTQTSHLPTLDLHCRTILQHRAILQLRAILQARAILQSTRLQKPANSRLSTPIWCSDKTLYWKIRSYKLLYYIYLIDSSEFMYIV